MSQFDQIIQRKGTGCAKWDHQGGDYIPMWVADMDFLAPPALLQAVEKRLQHGVFGYGAAIPQAAAAVSSHYRKTYGVELPEEWIVWIPSVMPGANIACRVGGGKILYSTPMYTHIRRLPAEAHTGVIEVPMKEHDLHYEMDFDALEQAVTGDTGVLVLCNPHNPVGRVYTRKELEQVADFARRHHLLVVSDEIHCELTLEGTHIPFFSLNDTARDHSITLSSAGKIANIPSLPFGFAIIPSEELRKKFQDISLGLFSTPNALSVEALRTAFDGSCDDWKEELRDYLRGNRDYLEQRIAAIPGLRVVHNEGTYLAWIDARETGIEDPFTFFKEKAGVRFNDGADYGQKGFVRLNFGCPRSQLTEALDRVEASLSAYRA
jgi:cystathionine beta-lyase